MVALSMGINVANFCAMIDIGTLADLLAVTDASINLQGADSSFM